MELEEIIGKVISKGTELWEPLVPDAVFSGVLIEDNEVAKSLKKISKDKEKLNLLYKGVNADLFVIEKPYHTFYNSNTVANIYSLSKETNGDIELTKERLRGEFGYKVYEIYKKMIDSKDCCLHKNNCPVNYLNEHI
jgi:hypothetical protein